MERNTARHKFWHWALAVALALVLAALAFLAVSLLPCWRQQSIERRLTIGGADVVCSARAPRFWPHRHTYGFFDVIDCVTFPKGHVDANELKLLGNCTELIILILAGTDVTDEGLYSIRNLQDLEMLDLSDTMVTGKSLKMIGGLDSLQWLIVKGTAVSDESLLYLERLPQLWMLDLSRTAIGDQGAVPLSRWCLTNLSLSDTRITDNALIHIGRMKQLRSLQLRGTAITNNGMEYLANSTSLHTLNVADTEIGDAGLERLRDSTQLQTLLLHGTCVTDRGVASLVGLNVEFLGLAHTRVTDDAVEHLVKIQSLDSLDITGTSITKEGVARLRETFPHLTNFFTDYNAPNVESASSDE